MDIYYENNIYTECVTAPLWPIDNQFAYLERYSCPNPSPEWVNLQVVVFGKDYQLYKKNSNTIAIQLLTS